MNGDVNEMKYLFCYNENEEYEKSNPDELFILNTVSDSLAKKLDDAEKEYDNSIKKSKLPRIFKRGKNSDESIEESKRKFDGAIRTAKVYLDVPQNAYECDVLSFDYLEESGGIEIDGGAFFDECSIFERDENVCIFHGLKTIYAISKREIKGIKVTDQEVVMLNWNKKDSAENRKYRAGGVTEDGDLNYFCTMEIEHGGESYGLAFPAYELDKISDITGIECSR